MMSANSILNFGIELNSITQVALEVQSDRITVTMLTRSLNNNFNAVVLQAYIYQIY